MLGTTKATTPAATTAHARICAATAVADRRGRRAPRPMAIHPVTPSTSHRTRPSHNATRGVIGGGLPTTDDGDLSNRATRGQRIRLEPIPLRATDGAHVTMADGGRRETSAPRAAAQRDCHRHRQSSRTATSHEAAAFSLRSMAAAGHPDAAAALAGRGDDRPGDGRHQGHHGRPVRQHRRRRPPHRPDGRRCAPISATTRSAASARSSRRRRAARDPSSGSSSARSRSGSRMLRAGVPLHDAFEAAVRAVRGHVQHLIDIVDRALPGCRAGRVHRRAVARRADAARASRSPRTRRSTSSPARSRRSSRSPWPDCTSAPTPTSPRCSPPDRRCCRSRPLPGLIDSAGYLIRFLEDGGWVAWGVVPTDGPIVDVGGAPVAPAQRAVVRAGRARRRSRHAAPPGDDHAGVRPGDAHAGGRRARPPHRGRHRPARPRPGRGHPLRARRLTLRRTVAHPAAYDRSHVRLRRPRPAAAPAAPVAVGRQPAAGASSPPVRRSEHAARRHRRRSGTAAGSTAGRRRVPAGPRQRRAARAGPSPSAPRLLLLAGGSLLVAIGSFVTWFSVLGAVVHRVHAAPATTTTRDGPVFLTLGLLLVVAGVVLLAWRGACSAWRSPAIVVGRRRDRRRLRRPRATSSI